MKMTLAIPFFLIAHLGGPLSAETTPATPAAACLGTSASGAVTDDCKASEATRLALIAACMDRLKAEAEAHANARNANLNQAHTQRARFLLCSSSARANVNLAKE